MKTRKATFLKKIDRPVVDNKSILINLKVKPNLLKLLDEQAKKLAGGNRSKLLLLSALNRRTPFKGDV